jgi:UDPglucose 6-dehydrogenase
LARCGHDVVGVDEDGRRVASLQEGRAPLFEPGLESLLLEGIESGRLRFATDASTVVPEADVVFIAYDTRVTDRDEADISEVVSAIAKVMPWLKPFSLLLIHSQVPVGTCRVIRSNVREARPDNSCEVAYVPENLRLGEAVDRFLHPDMLVVGAEDPRAYDIFDALFAPIAAPRVKTNLETAEMVKHAINAFLATSISFGNELANLCQAAGADGTKVMSILRLDRRVGAHVPIDPGMGFAGGTLARDMRIMQRLANVNAYRSYLIDAVLVVNEHQNSLPLRWLGHAYGTLTGLRVGVLGLTYKPGTSTLRRSAALEIVRKLDAEGVVVAAADPKADLSEVSDLPRFEFSRDPYAAASGKDALLLVTPWPEFKALDYERIRASMRHPLVLDMPNALDQERLERLGFLYLGVGRGTPVSFRRR